MSTPSTPELEKFKVSDLFKCVQHVVAASPGHNNPNPNHSGALRDHVTLRDRDPVRVHDHDALRQCPGVDAIHAGAGEVQDRRSVQVRAMF